MMEKHYDAKAAEAKWYQFWEKSGCFHDEPGKGTAEVNASIENFMRLIKRL